MHAYSGFENGMGLKQMNEIGHCSSSETQGEDHEDKLPAESSRMAHWLRLGKPSRGI